VSVDVVATGAACGTGTAGADTWDIPSITALTIWAKNPGSAYDDGTIVGIIIGGWGMVASTIYDGIIKGIIL